MGNEVQKRQLLWCARLATVGVALLLGGLLASASGLYRVAQFSRATFRPARTSAAGQAPAAAAGPPDATPNAELLGYTDSPLINRLRAGQRITILCLGYGGAGHDGAYLTDSLEVASIDPTTATITLLSIPRDLWVHIPAVANGQGDYWGKINEAYAVGVGNGTDYAAHDAGGQLAMQAVAQVIGIPIDYWVSLDFVGFRQFIDAIGGINVNVETAFTDTHYPNNDDADIDPSYKTIHFAAGQQHMDGEQALEYARSRYAPQDGTDFGRSRRQQRVMSSVLKQLATPAAIPRFLAILSALQGHVHTSLSLTDVRDLAGWAQERVTAGQRPTVRGGDLDVTTTRLLTGDTSAVGQDILVPAAGQGNYTAIRHYVYQLLTGGANTVPAP